MGKISPSALAMGTYEGESSHGILWNTFVEFVWWHWGRPQTCQENQYKQIWMKDT